MTLTESRLPSFTFSTDTLPPRKRFSAWQNVISPVLDIEAVERRTPRVCNARTEVVQFGELLISRVRLAGTDQRGMRAAHKIRRDLDHYVVEVYTAGGCKGDAGPGAFDLAPGGAGGRLQTIESALSDSVTITIPRALLDRRVPDAARLHGTVLRDGIGGLLGEYMLSLYRHLPKLSASEATRISQATVSMIAACLAPSSDNRARARAPVDPVLLERAKRFIDRNLRSPDLTVGRLCAALRVSRSHLYRAFEPLGGVAGYIKARRLSSIRAALLDPTDHRRISELAYDHGFASAAHFSRVFRQHFGLTPSDARKHARAGAAQDGHRAMSGGPVIET